MPYRGSKKKCYKRRTKYWGMNYIRGFTREVRRKNISEVTNVGSDLEEEAGPLWKCEP